MIAGFLLTGSLSLGADFLLTRLIPGAFDAAGGVENPLILVIMLAYVFVFATFGSYVCGRLAPRAPLKHALILGAIGLILGVVGAVLKWKLTPTWYHIVALLIPMVSAWLGGQIAAGRRRAREVAA